MEFSVVLVGAGNMGGAMLRGWLEAGLPAAKVTVLDPSPSQQMKQFLTDRGIELVGQADDVASPDVLVIAIKPQMMLTVLPEISNLAGDKTVAVSVAAGTTIETISSGLNSSAVVRTMPNTPSLVGKGMTVACPSSDVSDRQRDQVGQLLKTIGKLEWIDDEGLIDAVTGVSGSGPAYVFHLVECMAAAGVAAGLPKALADTLARQTIVGAGELLDQSSDDAATLRQNVTSPGGTTAAALEILRTSGDMELLLTRAVAAATDRSKELS